MPAHAHAGWPVAGCKSLERNILGFVGIAPVHETLIGMTGNIKPFEVTKWLNKLKRLGANAE